ncbi:MAG TPA: NAD-dependent epimerase/dehydratase family protein [Nocardioides sp.]|nr:NAD-dependent epimerase/dehydratase family protein [Nocardioides sp.]
MRVAIVGATGNVGSRLTALLAEEADVDEVVAVARREPDQLPAGVVWRGADLSRELPAGLLDGVDSVVHLGWLFQPSHDPAATWQANVRGTVRLLDAVVEAGVSSFVQASSVGAYSPRRDLTPVDESWPTHGIASARYSVEKAYVERVLDRFELEHRSVRVVRMRPAFIFQRSSAVQQRRLFMGPFVPAHLVSRTGVPLLPDPGGLVLQALHTDDVALAYRQAVLGDASGAFNLAADPPLTMADIARELGARVVRVPARPSRALLAAAWGLRAVPASPGMFDMALQIPMLDASRARAELGWRPSHDGRAAIRALLDGMRSAEGGGTPPLARETSGPLRVDELKSGVGRRP